MVAEIYLCHFSRLVIDYIVIYVILRYELNYPYNSIILADYKSQRETTSLRSVSLRRAGISAFLIEPDVWDMVQEEIDRRKKYGSSYSGNSTFSTRLVCGECGSLYGTKVWHSNDKYRRTIFQCNGKFKNGKKCSTPH